MNTKKFFKRITVAMLCAACLVGGAACTGGGKTSTNSTNSSSSEAEEKDEYKFVEREIKEVGQTYQSPYVTYPDELWTAPEYEYCSDLDFGGENTEGVKGLFFTSPIKYNGKPTKVAAYMGFPEGASKDNKVPAIVLVHGGLGTAFPDWVKYWNDKGFAAISIDTEGAEPISGVNNYNGVHKERNRYDGDANYAAGPTNDGYSSYDEPLENQWMYHATSATILAVSLIRSFDCVDPQRVGLTGISWGSTIVSIVISYDDRVTFCMPIYGLPGNERKYPSPKALQTWGDLNGLKQTNSKVFLVCGTKDTSSDNGYNSDVAKSINAKCLFKTGFPHGQEYGALEGDLPFYARYICGMESEFVEVMQNPTREDPTLKLRTYGDVEINTIKIYYTSASYVDSNTVWDSKSIKVIEDCLEYSSIPVPESTFAYVQIKYNKNLEVSTYIF